MKKRRLFEDDEPIARIRNLEGAADRIVEQEFAKPLTDEERSAMKEELVVTTMEKSRLEEEKKKIMKTYKDSIAPLAKTKSDLVRNLRHGNIICYGKLYLFIEGNTVNSYNEQGLLISTRPARPEEMQGTITQEIRKAQ